MAEGLYSMHKDLDPVPSTQEWKGGRDLNLTLYIFSTMIRMGKLNMLMVFKFTTIKKKKKTVWIARDEFGKTERQ